MSDIEMMGLKAKVRIANAYLGKLLKENAEIHSTDIFKVVTLDMREHVTIADPDIAKANGTDIVKIRGVA